MSGKNIQFLRQSTSVKTFDGRWLLWQPRAVHAAWNRRGGDELVREETSTVLNLGGFFQVKNNLPNVDSFLCDSFTEKPVIFPYGQRKVCDWILLD